MFLNQATLYTCQAPSFCLTNDFVWGDGGDIPTILGISLTSEYPPMACAVGIHQMSSTGQTYCMWSLGPSAWVGRAEDSFQGTGAQPQPIRCTFCWPLTLAVICSAAPPLLPLKALLSQLTPQGGGWSSSGCQLQESCLLKILERYATLRSRIFAAYYECARSSSWNWMFTECTTRNCWPFWRSLQRLCMIFWYQ